MYLKRKNFPVGEGDEALAASASDSMAQAESGTQDVPTPAAATDDPVPVDLSLHDERLEAELDLLETRAREAGRADIAGDAQALRTYLRSSRFTVAVVGEFNRGKSTLVNALVGSEVLPVGATPTTQIPAHVVGGTTGRLVARRGSDSRSYPLSARGWEALERTLDAEAAVPRVEVQVPCKLLASGELEFVDTPGVNSIIQGDVTMAEGALSACDCAIVVMGATACFSEAERLLIEERVVGRQVPRAMVVLTMLDLVDESQRESVVAYAERRLQAIAPGCPLLLSQEGLLSGWEGRAGAAAVADMLEGWLHESGHADLRRAAAREGMRALADELSGAYAAQLAVLREEDSRRAEAVEAKKREARLVGEIDWGTLEVEMLERGNQLVSRVREIAAEREADAVERLTIELSHSNNPHDWWETDYPYRARTEMAAFGNALESTLQGAYQRDVQWLNHELCSRYRSCVPQPLRQIVDRGRFRRPVEAEELGLEDMRQSRIISRVATGALTIGVYAAAHAAGVALLVVPGMGASVIAGVLSEVAMNRRVAKQKEELGSVMREQLDALYEQATAHVGRNVREAYRETVADLRATCEAWVEATCAALDEAAAEKDPSARRAALEERVAELEALGH